MKVIECMAKVLPDGSLAVPEHIRKELEPHTQVKVKLAAETPSTLDAKTRWQVFKNLGKDAVCGKLSDTSTKHDEYLYVTRN